MLTISSPSHSLKVFDYLIFVIICHRRKTVWPGFAIETKASSKLSRRKLRASSLAHARTHVPTKCKQHTHTHTEWVSECRLYTARVFDFKTAECTWFSYICSVTSYIYIHTYIQNESAFISVWTKFLLMIKKKKQRKK